MNPYEGSRTGDRGARLGGGESMQGRSEWSSSHKYLGGEAHSNSRDADSSDEYVSGEHRSSEDIPDPPTEVEILGCTSLLVDETTTMNFVVESSAPIGCLAIATILWYTYRSCHRA